MPARVELDSFSVTYQVGNGWQWDALPLLLKGCPNPSGRSAVSFP